MRVNRILAILAVLAVGLGGVGLALAQPVCTGPEIIGPREYKPHQLVTLQVTGVPKGTGYTWRVTPMATVERAATTKDRLQFAAHPGVYSVEVILGRMTPDGLELESLTATVSISSCYPPEKPNPSPQVPPKPDAPRSTLQAIGQIHFGSAGCTATPIEPRNPDGTYDLLTAAHCVRSVGQRGTFKSRDGRTMAVVVIARDERPDLAWLRTVTAGPDDLPMARLAREMPASAVDVWHAGFGIDKPGNTEVGRYVGRANADGLHAYDLSVSSGDSGGAIVWKDRDEVIGAVCCTSSRGAFARMYAGGAPNAWALRPKAAAQIGDTHDQEQGKVDPAKWQWAPMDIPRISG